MRTIKVLFPIVSGFLLAFGFVWSMAQAAGSQALTATILYVDAEATGPTHDGASWTTAYTTVQDALTIASIGTEIWVAEGVYYPDEGAGQTNDWISSTFALTDGVALYGGFDPDSGIDEFAERDWETYVTVLSGDIDQNDITDPDGVTTGITGTNAYHVISSRNVTITGIIDGFSITAGKTKGVEGHPDNAGGGMYNYNSSPTLTNLTFSCNLAANYGDGGGVYNLNSHPTLSSVTFFGNGAGWGGGMYNLGSHPTLSNVTFLGNGAAYGGGMYNFESHPTLIGVSFSEFRSGFFGGGMYNELSNPTLTDVTFFDLHVFNGGGGMYNEFSNPILTNVTFSNNSAHLGPHGGGGGGMDNYNSNPILNNVVFSENSAWFGGGMDNYNSSPTLNNVTFYGNGAAYGGGMSGGNGNSTLTNVTFFGNGAAYAGAGMHTGGSPTLSNVVFTGNEVDGSGGGMYNSGSPTLINVTFSGNHAGSGGGGIYNTAVSTPTLSNTIFWGNTSPISGTQIQNETGSIVLISYSDIQGCGGSGTGWDPACGTDNGHNIDADPLFLRNPDPGPGADDNWDGVNDDYGDLHLRAGSPAIDTGTNSGCPPTDLDGTPRPVNAICDLGAYEYLNLPPVAVDDGGWSFATDKDLPFTTASILANDWDPNDDPLTITGVYTSGILGLISDNGDGTFAYDPNGQFDYLAPGESATETFTYTLSDGQGGSDTATVTITVVDYYYVYLPLIFKQ